MDPFHSLRSKVDTAAALHEEEEVDDDFDEVKKIKHVLIVFRLIK